MPTETPLESNTSSLQSILTTIDSLPSTEDLVPKTRTINNKDLSDNITLTSSDIGADPSGTASGLIDALDFSDPTASGDSIQFIDSVSQSNGQINATKRTVRSASTSQSGIVQLSSSTSSTSTSLAATPSAVKSAYDLAAITSKKVKYLSKLALGYVWDIEDGTTPAYQQTVPSGARCVAVNGIGGKTEVFDGQLVSANVESVDSKDENSVLLGSLTIPQALRTAHPLHSAGTVFDEYDIERKKFIKRVGSVDLGTLNWSYNSGSLCMISNVVSGAAVYPQSGANNVLCANYLAMSSRKYTDNMIDGYIELSVGSTQVVIKDTSYTDANAFKAAMSGVMLYYELATPDDSQSIAEYFTDDNLLTVEAGGTVTFTQDNDVESNLQIPNATEYAINLSEAI